MRMAKPWRGEHYDARTESLRVGQVVRCHFDRASGDERVIAEIIESTEDRRFGSGRGVVLAPLTPCSHCGHSPPAVVGPIDAAWLFPEYRP